MKPTPRSAPRCPLFVVAVGGLALTGCAATPQGRAAAAGPPSTHFAFQLVHSDTELDSVEVESGPGTVDVPLERERVEARFAFGPEPTRGKFFFFGESFDQSLGAPFPPGVDTDLTVFGFGGGMSGAPVVGRPPGDDRQAPSVVVPYSWDIALAYGDDEDALIERVAYVEVRAALGFGLRWQGLQPSAGVTASAISGVLDGAGFGNSDDFEGFNAGAYGELRFAPPSTPILLHVRGVVGDIDSVEFGFGVQF